jgi:sRNA-binding carbon storage regulator CsrA
MLSLAVKAGEYVTITDNKETIEVHNMDVHGIRIAIKASRSWAIVRSDAKHKDRREEDNGVASVS